VLEAEILTGIKLGRDSAKDLIERDNFVEVRELTGVIPSEEVGVTDSH
jgi:hypothetical protein